MIDDSYITDTFVNKNGKIISARIQHVDKYEGVEEYLKNRYDEFVSYTHTVRRILNHIDELPVCQNCGKKLTNFTNKWCSSKCQLSDQKFIEWRNLVVDFDELTYKRQQTMLDKYGCKTGFQTEANRKSLISEESVKKRKKTYEETCLSKYGVKNILNLYVPSKETIIKRTEHVVKTMQERHGVKSYLQKEEARSKIPYEEIFEKNRKTLLEKYGVENWMQTQEAREKFSKLISSDEIQMKINNTKRQNGTFNTSKTEDETYELLKQKFTDVKRQYKSDAYPFNCDFYIPSMDLYIECQYSWTHGGHPFGKEKDDEDVFEQMMNEGSDYYKNAAQTWRYRDTKKRECVLNNSLNWLEFFSIDEFKHWLEKFEN